MIILFLICFLYYINNVKSGFIDISDARKECTKNKEDDNNKIIMRCMDSNDDYDVSAYDCAKAKYVHQCHKIRKSWLDSVIKPFKPSSIAIEDKLSSSFMMLFESYMLKKKPFKIDMTSYSNVSLDMCHENSKVHTNNNHEIPLSSCSDKLMSNLKTRVHLPSIVDAHYLNRISYDAISYKASNEGELNNYLTHWPALYTSNDNNWTKLQYCPLNMHMIVWGLTQKASVRLFLKSVGHKFKPEFGSNENMFPHYPDFVNNEIMNSNKDGDIPKYSKIVLDQAEVLFIPNNYLVQFKWDTSHSDHENSLIKFCLVDASNFKEVKDGLELEAALSPSADLILEKLSAFDFDTTMTKSPAERMWKDAGLKLDLSSTDASSIEIPSEAHNNSGKKDTSSRNRRRRGGSKGGSAPSAFKDWQSSAKWDVMIQSLTLPDPPIPTIYSVGRTNASISWPSYYRPSEQDTAFFAYNITICPETSIIDYTDSEGCMYEQIIKNMNLTETYQPKLSVRQGKKVFTIDLFYSNFVPDTSYRVRIVMLHASAVSDPSEWSASFKTVALSSPLPVHGTIRAVPADNSAHAIYVSFYKPIDNGGSVLLGYHALACKLGADVDRKCRYRWKGDFRVTEDALEQIVINNLQPSSKYKIQIAAFNEYGNSTFKTSNIVQTKPLSAFPKSAHDNIVRTVYGHGTKNHLSMQVEEHDSLEEYLKTHPLANMDHFTKTSNVFYIDDAAQTVHTFINGIKQEIEVWSSHWSPKSHIVASEAIFYDHFAEMEMVDLVGNIYGRIVIVTRDHVPIIVKALKAQNLGALAMVVIDNGKCNAFDQKCFPGSDKEKGELFAAIDTPKNWIELKIPVVFALQNDIKVFEDGGVLFPTRLDGFRNSIEVDPTNVFIEEEEEEEEESIIESDPEVKSESEVEDTNISIKEQDKEIGGIEDVDTVETTSYSASSEAEDTINKEKEATEEEEENVDEEVEEEEYVDEEGKGKDEEEEGKNEDEV